MDQDQIMLSIDRQRKAVLQARLRQGEMPTRKRTREQLIAETQQSRLGNRSSTGRVMRTSFIMYGYPPSISLLDQLAPMHIADLRLETCHRGRVVYLRTLALPCRFVAISTCVEDEEGQVDKISIYNESETISVDAYLPLGTIVAVKEPFYKATGDGGYTIRVDHPSDMIFLEASDSRTPHAWQVHPDQDLTATDYKLKGNSAYAANNHTIAVSMYTKALALSEAGSLLSYDLLRNRAAANLGLKRYEEAESDALNSVIKSSGMDSETERRLNNKSFYRAGRAAYELGNFEAAKSAFTNALNLSPNDGDVMAQLIRCSSRLLEKDTGGYDFKAMSESAAAFRIHSEHASFLSRTVVGQTTYAGRGLFASRRIEPGELVFCERAFHLASSNGDFHMLLNLNTNRGTGGAHANLLFAIIQKLRANPNNWATNFFKLHDGGYEPKCTAARVDGAAVIDTFQVQAIIEHNCFGTPGLRSSDIVSQAGHINKDGKDLMTPAGIWLHASCINHSCAANAIRSFLGDMMLVHATRTIAQGEEITMSYRAPDLDPDKRRESLQKTWGFECACPICSVEMRGSITERSRLKSLLEETEKLLKQNRLTPQRRPSNKVRSQAERLCVDLNTAYANLKCEGIPHLGLIDINLWLCQAYSMAGENLLAERTALEGLKQAGIHVNSGSRQGGASNRSRGRANNHRITVERSCCFLDTRAVDAAVYAAHSCFSVGNIVEGKAYQNLALEFHRTVHGEERGYVERYGELVT